MGDQVLDSTMDNAKDRALSMDNVSSMMRSPVADADNEGYGSYDELDQNMSLTRIRAFNKIRVNESIPQKFFRQQTK